MISQTLGLAQRAPAGAAIARSVRSKPCRRAPPPAQNKSRGNLRFEAGAAQVVANQSEKFLARGSMMSVSMRAKIRARWAVADAGDFDGAVFAQQSGGRATVAALDFFGFGDRSAQADGEIVGEMIAADGHGAGVANHSAAINNHFGGAAADVQQAAAQVAFILRQAGFRGGQRLEHRVVDQDAGFIRGGNQILRGGYRGSDHVNVGFQALADHADGVADAVLRVDAKFMRQNVQHFAIVGKRNVARGVDSAAHIFALDVARARTKGDAAAAVHAAHMISGYPNDGGFDRNVGDTFGFFDGAANAS